MVTLAPIRIQESRGEGPYAAIDRYYTIADYETYANVE
jgi:hypothetical protein